MLEVAVFMFLSLAIISTCEGKGILRLTNAVSRFASIRFRSSTGKVKIAKTPPCTNQNEL